MKYFSGVAYDPNYDPDDAEFERLLEAKLDGVDVDPALDALYDQRAAEKRETDRVAVLLGENPDPPWTPIDGDEIDPESDDGETMREIRRAVTLPVEVDSVTHSILWPDGRFEQPPESP
jgi:hypothetical protein